MSLERYRQKRSFNKTPEPKGGKAKDELLRFVVQKHAASHLHYDFRLEMRGVLKSWAVPKGPSTDPEIKRLAMMVEDHPYDYRSFEGIIPAGEYGGGTVIVWDEGTYEAADAADQDKKSQEKELLLQIQSGRLKIVLHGKKLKGEFALVKTSGRGENGWLLMKVKDKYASTGDILRKHNSVVSGLTLEEVAASSTNIYGQKGRGATKESSPRETKAERKTAQKPKKLPTRIAALLQRAKKAKLPGSIKPMLPKAARKMPEEEGWTFEVDWGGYRSLAITGPDVAELGGGQNKVYSKRYYPVQEVLNEWPAEALIDGQIVVLDKRGAPDPVALKKWTSSDDGHLVYYVHDLLWYEGYDLRKLSLVERNMILKQVLPASDIIRLNESFKTEGSQFLHAAQEAGLQRVFARKVDSVYQPGLRSTDWLAIKVPGTAELPAQNKSPGGKSKASVAVKQGGKQKKEKASKVKPGAKTVEKLLNETDDVQVKRINGRALQFNNLSKLYWPEEGISKRDMINYYHEVTPFMLPYLKDRPMSLNRHPNGIHGQSFYQKDVTGKVPEWMETMAYQSESQPGVRNFLVCSNEASLLYMASMGCIEMNPWSSRVGSDDYPDWCIIDLDPGERSSFEQVIEAAQITHDVLEAAGCPSYCKTSGSTGLHIYVPLGAKYTYEQSREFARLVVTLVQRQLSDITSIERSVSRRKGKMYLDFLQNRWQATLAAAYSLRPKPGATVSMPLHWEEVRKGLRMSDFNISNAIGRLGREGDIFKKVLGKGIDLDKMTSKIRDL